VQEEVVHEVADAVNALGQNAQRADFLNLAIQYAGDDERLQAMVGLARPVFDYLFFQEMTVYIGQAPAAERDQVEALRERLLELTMVVDQQAQMALQESAGLLQAIVDSPNPDELIAANVGLIDYTFMQVLAANIQEAERRKDLSASARLKDIYSRVVAALQANMPPELRFINQLLTVPSEDDARSLIADRIDEFGDQLLAAIDAVEGQLTAQGNPNLLDRLAFLRNETVQALG
jgi:hypothetical protein